MSILDPIRIWAMGNLWITMLSWAFTSAVYILLYQVTLSILYHQFSNVKYIFLPALSLILVNLLFAPFLALYFLFNEDLGDWSVGAVLAKIVICFLVEQILFIIYLILGSVPDNVDRPFRYVEDSSTATTVNPRAVQDSKIDRSIEYVQIGSFVFKLQDIYYLSANRHHVVVKTHSAESTIRTSFSTAVEAMPSWAGYQIHRSYWVPYSNIHSLFRADKKDRIRLRSGHNFPVANTRKAGLIHGFSEYRKANQSIDRFWYTIDQSGSWFIFVLL